MNTKKIIWIIIIALLLTSSSFFIKIIPCKSWHGSNTGLEDNSPHNEFCKIHLGEVGPHNEYFYLTTSPTVTLIILFGIFLTITFSVSLLLKKK
jgi:hypothetical protein